MAVFDDVLISALFNCIQVFLAFYMFCLGYYAYFIVM